MGEAGSAKAEDQRLADGLAQVVWISVAGATSYLNRYGRDYLGVDAEEITTRTWLQDFVHPDDVQRAREAWRVAAVAGTPYEAEYRLKRKDGEFRWMLERGVPQRREGTTGLQWTGSCTDIEDHKQTAAALQKAKDFAEKVIETANVLFVQLDMAGRVVRLNASAEQTTGYARGELEGKSWFDILVPNCRYPHVRETFQRIVTEGTATTGRENPILTKSGEERQILWNSSLVREGEAAIGTISFGVDITDRRRAEEGQARLERQLLLSQKMEAVGQLAGGVAHDFNNLLGVMMGYAEIARRDAAEGTPLRGRLDQILKAAERAAGLTRQLLAFSRQQVLAPSVLSLNRVVSGLEEMLARLIGEDVHLTASLDPDAGCTKADLGQIEQVVVNLAVNARDAMPVGGVLTVGTANEDVGADHPARPLVPPGRYVVLSVRDTGVGMDAETQTHVFEPFFTTKELGKGTGLGLATVYGIVKQSEGHVAIQSELGVGTTVRVYLPRVDEPATPENPKAADVSIGHANETVLLIEDEPQLREVVCETLEGDGYTVLVAPSGAAALQIAADYAGVIHLIVTDVIMPGISGLKAVEQILPARPKVKILFISGYTDGVVAPSDLLAGAEFLGKPFTHDELLRRARRLLRDPR